MNTKNIILLLLAVFGFSLFLFLQNNSKDNYSSFERPRAPLIDMPASPSPAPDFTLVDLDNNEFQLSDARGKIIAMTFWTTWWPTCREELPSLDKLNREYANKGLQVLLINMKEQPSSITSFMEKHNYSSRVLLDLEGEVAKKYDVFGIPVSFLIDKDGRVVYRLSGFVDWDSKEIRSLVHNLINDKRTWCFWLFIQIESSLYILYSIEYDWQSKT